MGNFSVNPSAFTQVLSAWIQPFQRLVLYMLSFIYRLFTLKIRILPLVIFCASTLFTVKMTQLIQKTNSSHFMIDFRTAEAETVPETPKPQNTPSDSKTVENSPPSSMPSVKIEEKASKSQEQSVKFSDFDPLKMSAHEFKVLQELSNRENQLDQQQNSKPSQESTLKAIEEQIQKKAAALNESQKKLEDLLNKTEVQEDSNIIRLAKVAENMKAKEAAKILEGVKFEVLVEIMEKIKEAKVSAILSNMEPEKASYLMTELALRKKIFKKDPSINPESAAPAA